MPFNEKATRGMKPKDWITILAMMILRNEIGQLLKLFCCSFKSAPHQ
jgi:hypothetical protein